MTDVKIPALPLGVALTGNELFECVQAGNSVKIPASFLPSMTESYLTLTAAPLLPDARRLVNGTGITFTDSGPGGTLTISFATETISLADLSDVTLTGPIAGQVLGFDGSVWANTSSPGVVFAAPSGVVGLVAVAGVATTSVRSDSSPALSQSIAPNWTGVHTYIDQALPATPAAGRTSIYSNVNVPSTGISQLNILNNGSSIAIGYETHMIVYNQTGGTLAAGQFVYINGSHALTPTVALAKANATSTLPAAGFLQYAIPNNSYGVIHINGTVNNLNTNAVPAGSPIFISDTVAGGYTTVPPSGSNYVQFVGVVTNQHPTQGVIQIGMQTPLAATVFVAAGGTGLTSYTIGDLIYASGATTLSKLADVAVGSYLASGGVGVAPAWAAVSGLGANPTGTIGLAAVNGTAATFLRSDGAPALSQAIVPTWSGIHTFSALYGAANTQAIQVSSAVPAMLMKETDAAANAQKWVQYVNSSVLNLSILNDAETVQRDWMSIARSTGAISSLAFGNATDNPAFTFLGTGSTIFSGNVTINQPATGSGLLVNTGANAGNGVRVQFNSSNIPVSLAALGSNGHGYIGFNTVAVAGSDTQNYAVTSGATRIRGDSSAFIVANAPSGTAGNPITWTDRLTIGSTGTVTIPGAIVSNAVGAAFNGTGATTNNQYIRFTNTGGDGYFGVENSAGGGLFSGDTSYSMVMGSSGATDLFLGTNGIARMKVASNGAITMNAPTAGSTLAIVGLANNYAMRLSASSTASQSFGALIDGGTNSGDVAINVRNQAGTLQMFTVNGVGGIAVNNGDYGAAGQVLQSGGSAATTRWSGGAAATTSNESRTSTTTLTNITALSGISLTPGTYALEGYFSFDLSAQPGGAKIFFTHTGGTASGFYSYNGTINSAAVTSANLTEGVNVINGSPVSSGDYVAVRGTLIVSGTTTVNVQFAQFSSNGTATTILPGAFVKYYRVN